MLSERESRVSYFHSADVLVRHQELGSEGRRGILTERDSKEGASPEPMLTDIGVLTTQLWRGTSLAPRLSKISARIEQV